MVVCGAAPVVLGLRWEPRAHSFASPEAMSAVSQEYMVRLGLMMEAVEMLRVCLCEPAGALKGRLS